MGEAHQAVRALEHEITQLLEQPQRAMQGPTFSYRLEEMRASSSDSWCLRRSIGGTHASPPRDARASRRQRRARPGNAPCPQRRPRARRPDLPHAQDQSRRHD